MMGQNILREGTNKRLGGGQNILEYNIIKQITIEKILGGQDSC